MAHPRGDSDLYHIIYASSATERLSQSELLELLKVSRRKNEARGLTGMLLYRDGTYMQFLEGQRKDIDLLLARLRNDPRHEGIHVLREGMLSERLFPDWSMAYKSLGGLRTSSVQGYSERLQAQHLGEPDKPPSEPDAIDLLTGMFQQLLVAR